MSMLAVQCTLLVGYEMVREGTGHLPSYAKAKKNEVAYASYSWLPPRLV